MVGTELGEFAPTRVFRGHVGSDRVRMPMTPRGDAPRGGWESLKVAELSEELESRGLPKSGKKAELVARLQEDDASGGAPGGSRGHFGGDPGRGRGRRRRGARGQARPPAPWRRRGGCPATKPARRTPEGEIVVFARARYVRGAPRKARLVMDHIRGKPVEQAQAFLRFAPRAVSTDILKLLNSAVANADRDTSWARTSFASVAPSWTRAPPSSGTGPAPWGAPRASTSARAT